MQDNDNQLVKVLNSFIPQTATMIFTTAGGFLGVKFIADLGLDALTASNYISTIQSFTITTLNSAISYHFNQNDDNEEAIAKGPLRNIQRSYVHTIVFTGLTFITLASTIPIIRHFSGDEIASHVRDYSYWFAPGVPAMFLLNTYRQALLKQELPWLSPCYYLLYQLLDTFLSYGLINGRFMLPKMGIAGLGLANTISIWITVLLFTVDLYERYENDRIDFFEYRLHNKITSESIKALLKEAWIKFKDNFFYSYRIFTDQSLLFITSIMLGKMGNNQNAAQEAAYQYIPICSTFVFGIKDTIGKLVGNSKDLKTVKQTAYIGLIYALMVTSIPFVIFLATPDPLLEVFLSKDTTDNQEILRTARHLLWINGAGLICDGVRNNCLSTLNNFNLPKFPLALIGVAVLGIFLAYFLGFDTSLEASGVMLARTLVLAIGAILSLAMMVKFLNFPNVEQASINEPRENPNETTPLLNNSHSHSDGLLTSSKNYIVTTWNNYASFFCCPSSQRNNKPSIKRNNASTLLYDVNVQRGGPTNIPGLIYHRVPDDGHCLFHAVGLYLGEDQAYMRRIVAAHLEHNLEAFREFIVLPTGQTLEGYLQAVREGKEWADHIEIEILMRVTDQPIVVIDSDARIRNSEVLERGFKGEPIFVFYNGHTHYDAYLRRENAASQDILNYLTQLNEHSLNNQRSLP